jgi:hypothetical protein
MTNKIIRKIRNIQVYKKKPINPRFHKLEHKEWCPMFRGQGSEVICIGNMESRNPYFVHAFCKNRKLHCKLTAKLGYPPDVELREGEFYNPELLAEYESQTNASHNCNPLKNAKVLKA